MKINVFAHIKDPRLLQMPGHLKHLLIITVVLETVYMARTVSLAFGLIHCGVITA